MERPNTRDQATLAQEANGTGSAPQVAMRRCDTCGRHLPITKFHKKRHAPSERELTCRECAAGSHVITCRIDGCDRTRRTRSNRTLYCHLHALKRKLGEAKSWHPVKCHRCDTKFLRLFKDDRECGLHHDHDFDRINWAHGDCKVCGQSDTRVWSVDVPVCVRCLKDRDKRIKTLNMIDRTLGSTAADTATTQAAKAAHEREVLERYERERQEAERRREERRRKEEAMTPEEHEARAQRQAAYKAQMRAARERANAIEVASEAAELHRAKEFIAAQTAANNGERPEASQLVSDGRIFEGLDEKMIRAALDEIPAERESELDPNIANAVGFIKAHSNGGTPDLDYLIAEGRKYGVGEPILRTALEHMEETN